MPEPVPGVLAFDRPSLRVVEYTYQRAHVSFSNALDLSLGLGTSLRGTCEAHAVTVGLSSHFQ